MMATNFIWSRFYIQTSISVKVTCPLLKFSSNLKPQARNLCNNILNNLSVLRLQRRLNFLHNWGCKSLLFNTDLIRTSFHRNVKYSLVSCDLFSSNIIISTQKCSFYHSCKVLNESHDSNSSSRLYPLTNYSFYCNTFRNYSNKKSIINNKQLSIKRHEYIRGVLREKQRRIRQTQQHLKSSGKLLLDDIKRTKSKMKVRMEEIIERENVWTIPNMLCVARIAISPYLGYVIIQSDYKLALGLLLFAGVTDLLDGLIARTFKSQSSKLGSFLDPMADKVLIATLFLTLTFSGNMPVPLTVLIVTRDVALTAAGFYIRYQSLPPPRTLSRYFDMTHATAQLSPTMISKVNTMIQLVTVFSTVAAAAFECTDSPALYALWYLTAGSTVASAASYLTAKNTYKLLKRKKTK